MKLISQAALAILALSLVSFTTADQIDDTEIEIEDDEAEIEDDSEGVQEEIPEELQPQLSQVPLEGIRSFIFFPDGPASITGGKMSEVVIGVQNNGDKDIEMVSCGGRMMMPGNPNWVRGFNKLHIPYMIII